MIPCLIDTIKETHPQHADKIGTPEAWGWESWLPFWTDAETEKYEFRLNEIEALRNAETNSEELLNNGFATYLDLLTARQSALSAELNVVDSKLQQQLYIIDLYEALGGGWQ